MNGLVRSSLGQGASNQGRNAHKPRQKRLLVRVDGGMVIYNQSEGEKERLNTAGVYQCVVNQKATERLEQITA